MLTGLFLGLLLSATLGFFPGMQDPYLPFRTVILFAFTGLGCLLLSFEKKLNEQARSLTLWVATILLWTLFQWLLDSLRVGGGSTSMGIIRDFAIASLAVLALNLMHKEANFLYNFAWLNTLLASMVAGLGMAQLAGAELPWFPSSGLKPENLTNINMMAQYLGLSLGLAIFLYSQETALMPRIALVLASGSMLTYPLLIACRSVLIGICLVLALAIVVRRLKASEAIAIIMATAFFAIFIAQPISQPSNGNMTKIHWINGAEQATQAAILNQTYGSSLGRNFLWQQTLVMIKEQPWLGFGRGSYEQAAAHYVLQKPSPFRSETTVVDSPRNEFLQLFSDIGLPLGIGLLVGFAFLLIRAIKNRNQSKVHLDQTMIAAFLGLILFTEAMFQAPLLRPIGIIFFSFFLSLIFSLQPKFNWPVLPIFWLRGSLVGLALIFMLQAFRLGYAEFASSDHSLASRNLATACQLLPEHWRVCLQYSKALMHEGRWQEAHQLNMTRLAIYPGFHPSERIAALSAWNQGKKADACILASRYQQQFQMQNSLFFISKQCGPDISKN